MGDASDPRDPDSPESMSEVLASIRALVSAESAARARAAEAGDVLMLTAEMRVDAPVPSGAARSGEVLAGGLEELRPLRLPAAPILDEEALRDVVNEIVREELQGELGERISRNLRKLIRRELAQVQQDAPPGDPQD